MQTQNLFKRHVCAALVLAATTVGTLNPAVYAQTATDSCDAGIGLWAGSFGYGASCADSAGFRALSKQNKALANDLVTDIEICGDRVVVAHALGLNTLQQGKWRTERMKSGIQSPAAIDCDSKNNLWIAHYDGVSKFDGKTWTTTRADKLGTDANVKVSKDIAVGPKDTVWVATSNSVARFDGKDWRFWEGEAFGENKQFFSRIVVDPRGAPWVSAIGGIYTFDDDAWVFHKNSDLISNEGLAVDAEGSVYVGSTYQGLYIFSDGDWSTVDRDTGLSSNSIREIAIDGRGRIWVGTQYGMNVFDGKKWRNFDMSTTGMIDNDVTVLEIEGAGPELPSGPLPVKTGTLAGKVSTGTKPAAGIDVQLCVEFIGLSFNGSTPCGDQPYSKLTKTDKDGAYRFEKIPAGVYGVVFKQPSGKWARLTTTSGFGTERIVVAADAVVGGIDLDLAKVK